MFIKGKQIFHKVGCYFNSETPYTKTSLDHTESLDQMTHENGITILLSASCNWNVQQYVITTAID